MKAETVDVNERHDREPPWVSADREVTERLWSALRKTKVSRLRDPKDPEPFTYRILMTTSAATRLADRLEQWKHLDEQERQRVSAEVAEERQERRKRRRALGALVWSVFAAALAFVAAWGVLWWVTLPVQPVQDGFALVMGRLLVLAAAYFAGLVTYFHRKDRRP